MATYSTRNRNINSYINYMQGSTRIKTKRNNISMAYLFDNGSGGWTKWPPGNGTAGVYSLQGMMNPEFQDQSGGPGC